MYIDDVAATTWGVIVQDRGRSRSAVRTKKVLASSPQAWRSIVVGRDTPEPLMWTCAGVIQGTSLSNLQSRMDEFKYRTRPNKEITLRWSDQSGREWAGYRESLEITDFDPGWVQTYVRFTLSVLCADPRGRDTSDTNATDSGTPTSNPATTGLVNEITVGSAPHPSVISITGNTGSPLASGGSATVYYYDSANAATGYSFTISPSITWDGSAIYRINTETLVCEYSEDGGSSWDNGGGDFSGDYFEFDPIHVTSGWPSSTVDARLTATGGTCDEFKVTYRKRYW